MHKRCAILITTTAILVALMASTCLARSWSDRSGRHADADFVSFTDGIVKALRSEPAMASVEPDVELQLAKDDDDEVKPLTEVNKEVIDAYEHAGRMVCVWKKGTKDEAKKVIGSIKQFTKVEYSEPLRLAV